MAQVVLEHLTKVFPAERGESVSALKGFSLKLEHKELLVLVGPSASGKTTTLRLLAGLERPTSGTISVGGTCINDVSPGERDVAMVFQTAALYPHLSVYENLAFGLKVRKTPRAEIQRRVQEMAQRLGLTDCLDRMPMAISGGQRQRVALGRALVRRPALLLLDEPFSNLDPQLRLQLRAELASLHSALELTTVYVTHDQGDAMALGGRLAVLNAGELQQAGPPLELYRKPANLFVAGFIGSPTMNFFNGRLAKSNGSLYFQIEAKTGVEAQRLALGPATAAPFAGMAERPLILGLRPEQISPQRNPPATPLGTTVTAQVHRAEIVGADAYCAASAGPTLNFTFRVPACEAAIDRQPKSFEFQMDQACFFDPESGRALVP